MSKKQDYIRLHKLKFAVVLSLVLHLLFFTKEIADFSKSAQKFSQNKPTKIRLKFKKPSKANQIVHSNKKESKTKPLDTKFLSKKNQKFDRQTVAKTIGKNKDAGLGSKRGSEAKPSRATKPQKSIRKKIKKMYTSKRNIKKKLNKKLGELISLGDLSVRKVMPNIKKQILQKFKGLKSGTKGKRGLATNNDFIEDIPLGDVTHLNTVEYKYYGFYFRIRQKLEQYWGNTLKSTARKLFKRGRSIASDMNHITSLQIILDNNGNIVDIHIKGTSGVTELDAAAVESFNKAGPFPNPPKGMLSNGRAHIEWGFVVKG